jgi:hypothetical protein
LLTGLWAGVFFEPELRERLVVAGVPDSARQGDHFRQGHRW